MIQTKYSDDTRGMHELGSTDNCMMDEFGFKFRTDSAHARELLCEGLDKARFNAELVRELSELKVCR